MIRSSGLLFWATLYAMTKFTTY